MGGVAQLGDPTGTPLPSLDLLCDHAWTPALSVLTAPKGNEMGRREKLSMKDTQARKQERLCIFASAVISWFFRYRGEEAGFQLRHLSCLRAGRASLRPPDSFNSVC